MANISFLDLQTQYRALKTSIDQRIQKVLDHGAFVMGPEITECEKVLSDFVGCKHTLTCSSGTDALVIPLMALGVGPGDEVITTAFSFIATVEAIVLVGATPVLVDIDPVTYNLRTDLVEKAITSKTKVIMPVSLYGQPCDMDELNALAKKHNLTVIEDAAQSFGAEYKGKKVGNLTHITATSFFPAKPLGCYGDGGAMFTNDDTLKEKMALVRNHGQKERYHHTAIGVNGRFDTLQAAIILSKMERFPWEVTRRQELADRYISQLKSSMKDGYSLPVVKSDRKSIWAQFTLRAPKRDQFGARLKELGIPTAVHYPRAMNDQPAYTKLCKTGDVRESQKAALEVISLPLHPELTNAQQDQIIEAIKKAMV